MFTAAASHYDELRRIGNLFDVMKGTSNLDDFAKSFKTIVDSSGFTKLVVYALREPVNVLREDDFVILRPSPGSDFAKIAQPCRMAHEGIGDFPNKPGKQNDRFPISGKRSFFVFGGHMPSLPVTGSSIWISRCPACWDSGQRRFARLYIPMHCLPGLSSCNPPPTALPSKRKPSVRGSSGIAFCANSVIAFSTFPLYNYFDRL